MGFICFMVVVGASLASAAGLTPSPLPATVNEPGSQLSVVRVGPNGRLIRVLRGKAPGKTERNEESESGIARLVDEASKRYQVDPLLVHSVIRTESNFNPAAVSPKGAQGLMQLIPSTAQRFGVTDPFDPKQNIEGGVRYLKYLQDRFPSDVTLSIAAYNAGEGAVTKYHTVPPYPETIGYVQKVSSRYNSLSAAKPAVVAAVENPGEAVPEEPPLNHVEQFFDAQGRLYLRTR